MPLLPALAPEQQFWQWFEDNEAALLAVESGGEPVCASLARMLHAVHPDLAWEIGPRAPRRELVISAGGNRRAFPAVEALAAAAPPLPRWTVVRFRPPRDPRGTIALGGLEVCSDDVRVRAERDGGKVGLTVRMEGYRGTPEHLFEQIGFLFLDRALGEYVLETRIGFIDFADPAVTTPDGFLALHELRGAVGRLGAT